MKLIIILLMNNNIFFTSKFIKGPSDTLIKGIGKSEVT